VLDIDALVASPDSAETSDSESLPFPAARLFERLLAQDDCDDDAVLESGDKGNIVSFQQFFIRHNDAGKKKAKSYS